MWSKSSAGIWLPAPISTNAETRRLWMDRRCGTPPRRYDRAVAALEDLEARVAALEASGADYRAVLAAVNALGVNQREMALAQREMALTQREHSRDLADLTAGQRSLEDGFAEVKTLLVRALEG
jgi:hypothetical protein